MQVVYKNCNLQKVCTDFSVASRKYVVRMASIIQIRVKYIKSARAVEDMLRIKAGRCHALKGQRAGRYAMVVCRSCGFSSPLQADLREAV